jgi:hypothetical protein
MSDTILLIRCPSCGHDQARLFVSSATVVTVKCARCEFPWSVDVTSMPDGLRKQLPPQAMHRP